MKTPAILTAAALCAALLPAHAVLIDDAALLAAPAQTITFDGYDGLLTTGPEALSAGVTFTGDAGSELGANNRDLGSNGLWGAATKFAAGGFVGELRFTFADAQAGAGAFVNHWADDLLPYAIVVSAYGDDNRIVETHTVTVDTDMLGYNEGLFVGIARPTADIRSLSFKGVGIVVDDFTHTAVVPEPATTAMLLAGLGVVGLRARRRRG